MASETHATKRVTTDIAVIGAGVGGVAAGLTAASLDKRVFLSCETEWIGGQLSAQAVPPDEHPWIESTGCTRTYRVFRENVRDFYRRHYPLKAESRVAANLNPGMGNVSGLCHEPWVAAHVLLAMVAPFRSCGRFTLATRVTPIEVETEGDRVEAVILEGEQDETIIVEADYFLDATELGDLVHLSGTEYVVGAEGRRTTGEPHCPTRDAEPLEQQAPSWSAALDLHDGEHDLVVEPRDYEFWREYEAEFWPGSQLGWTVTDIATGQPRHRPLFAAPPQTEFAFDLWHLRRVLSAGHFDANERGGDITIANWPAMDYWIEPLIDETGERDENAWEGTRQLALSYLRWIQTEAPRHDGGRGYPEVRLRPSVVGTDDGLAQHPYIRESRRIEAVFTVKEQHIGVAARERAVGAATFPDTVGVGAYRMDLHPTPAGTSYIDLDTWPFQIPLGALIPVRVTNLIAAGKNIGTTHVANGAYRVHPVEWNIGESAGALAAFCLDRDDRPRQVQADPEELDRFQTLLADTLGVQLSWPDFGPLRPTDRIGWLPPDDSSTP